MGQTASPPPDNPRPLSSRLGALWSRRGPRGYLAVLALASLAAAFAPLVDHLGYEFSELCALLAGSLGAAVGVASARLELSRDRPYFRPALALTAAALFSLLALALPLALILLNGLRRPACDPLFGLALYATLALPSGLLSSTLGCACAFAAPRRAAWLVALVFLLSLAGTLWPILFGPQVFAFHHLGGAVPGPIYDEAIALTPALGWFRLATLGYTVGLAGLTLLFARQPTPSPSASPSPAPSPWSARHRAGLVLAVAGFAPALLLSSRAESLHFCASNALLDDALGARIETPLLILHVPREKTPAERRLLALDAEASARAVLRFFGTPGATPAKVDVFLYRSTDEKRRLIGAAETSFAKPWLRVIHTSDLPAPHPILRHELVHALGADLLRSPFGVPGRLFGLLPDMAFIEGFAVAGDFPGGEATIHEETAALRTLGKLPDLVQLFRPGRFYAEPGPRAYTAAGSLLRWVWETRGPEALRAAYASPVGLAALGPLEELVRGHSAFLDTVRVPAPVLALAALRFSAPSVLHKHCAHEVAALEQRAALAGTRGQQADTVALLRTCALLEPDDPNKLFALRRALLDSGDEAGAQEVLERLLVHEKLSTPQRAQALVDLGDRAWKRGEVMTAGARYSEAARLTQPEPQARLLLAKRTALAHPETWPALRRLLVDGDGGPEVWLLLRDLDLQAPRDGLAAFLLAKQAQNKLAWETCVRFARSALSRTLPDPRFALEARRMLSICALHAGDLPTARAAFDELKSQATPGQALELERYLDLLAPP